MWLNQVSNLLLVVTLCYMYEMRVEGMKETCYVKKTKCTRHTLFMVMWAQSYGEGPFR